MGVVRADQSISAMQATFPGPQSFHDSVWFEIVHRVVLCTLAQSSGDVSNGVSKTIVVLFHK